MSRLLLFVVLLLVPCKGNLVAQAPPPAPLASVGSTEIPIVIGSGSFTWWTGGVLIVVRYRYSGAPVFCIIGREGKEISRFTFMLPDAGGLSLRGNEIARGPDGSFAVIGHAYFNDIGPSNFLAVLSPEGELRAVEHLLRFLPAGVTIASDGAIWIVGHEPAIAGPPDREQNLLRRYDRAAKPLRSFLLWSSLDLPQRWPSPDSGSVLASATDRVAWYSPSAQTYFEFALDGNLILQVQGPQPRRDGAMLSLAVCNDRGVFLSATRLNGPNQKASWGIFALNRFTGEWTLHRQPERWGRLYGCDGSRLAATSDSRFISWLAPTTQ